MHTIYVVTGAVVGLLVLVGIVMTVIAISKAERQPKIFKNDDRSPDA